MSTILDAHVRGGTFIYAFTLGNDWVGSDFTGGVWFTLRKKAPSSATSTDMGPDVIDQASVAAGSIVFVAGVGTITIPASKTRKWPVGEWFWDLHGVVDAAVDVVKKIDYGTINIVADYTRR